MTQEEQDIAAMVRRYASADEGGKAPRAYVAIYGGSASAKARKLTANVDLDDGRTVEEIVQDVLRRISTAKAEGPKRLYCRTYLRGDSSPADVVVLEGDPAAAREGDAGEEATSLAAAHAMVVTGLLGEVRWLSSQLQQGAAQYAELGVKAAATWAELEVRQELGFQRSLSDAADKITANLAPHLGALAQVIQALRAQGGAPGQATAQATPGTPGDEAQAVRDAVAKIESAAADLAQALTVALAAGKVDEALKTEVATRLRALVAGMGIA